MSLITSGDVLLPPPEQFGFCEGVYAADELLRNVTEEARLHGIDFVYCFHKVVHNTEVCAEHQGNGVIFVENLDQIPDQSIVVTSAHGVGPEVNIKLQEKGCEQFDAACPLVVSTHVGIQAARREGEKVVYICHDGPGKSKRLHDEIAGSIGHMDYYINGSGDLVYHPVERVFVELHQEPSEIEDLWAEAGKYRIITQTTQNDRECLAFQKNLAQYIRSRQPDARISRAKRTSVCKAVGDRQAGVPLLLNIQPRPERVVVVTDLTSSNGMSYYDLACRLAGPETEVLRIATAAEATKISKEGRTAITASASTPDKTTKAVAVAFGADPALLRWERKGFRLEDGGQGQIQAKIAALLGRLGLAS